MLPCSLTARRCSHCSPPVEAVPRTRFDLPVEASHINHVFRDAVARQLLNHDAMTGAQNIAFAMLQETLEKRRIADTQ